MEDYKLMIEKYSPEVHQYIQEQVNPFIQPLLCQLVLHRPPHALNFAIQWLTAYAYKLKCKDRSNAVTSDSDSQDEGRDLVKSLQEKIQKKRRNKERNSRMGISEEVFGKFNAFKNDLMFTDQGIDDGQAKLVNSVIHSSILFQNLDSKDEEILRRAIVVKQAAEDELIIREGEQGNAIYIVQSGEYDCYKVLNDENIYVKTYVSGQTFGELSLMYNSPRAASIVTKTAGKLLILDRSTFSQVLKVAALRKHGIIKGVIERLQILKEIPIEQKHQFISILKEEKFAEGEYVIQEGEEGSKFYIVLQGQLVAEKQEKEGEEYKQVYKYGVGDYFGELALLNDQKRQASVKAVSGVKLAAITREGFKRVFGAAEQIFKEQAQKYHD